MLLLLLAWVIVEVAAFVAVAHEIGVLLALLVLVLVSALGPAIVRRVGFGVVAHARERLDLGQPPTREVLDGVLVLAGGVMICVPGFVGDALGLLVMLRPVRGAVIGFAGHRISRRLGRPARGPAGWAGWARGRAGGPVIDTTSSDRPGPGGPRWRISEKGEDF